VSAVGAYIVPSTGNALAGFCWPNPFNPRGSDAEWELSCYGVYDSFRPLAQGVNAAYQQQQITKTCAARALRLMQTARKPDGSFYDTWEEVPLSGPDYQWLNRLFQAIKDRAPLPVECTPVPGTALQKGFDPSYLAQPTSSIPWGWIIAGTVVLGSVAVWYFLIRPRRKR